MPSSVLACTCTLFKNRVISSVDRALVRPTTLTGCPLRHTSLFRNLQQYQSCKSCLSLPVSSSKHWNHIHMRAFWLRLRGVAFFSIVITYSPLPSSDVRLSSEGVHVHTPSFLISVAVLFAMAKTDFSQIQFGRKGHRNLVGLEAAGPVLVPAAAHKVEEPEAAGLKAADRPVLEEPAVLQFSATL